MENMDLDEPIMYRIQCVKCNIFLSMPFKLTAESMEVKEGLFTVVVKEDFFIWRIFEVIM